MYRGAREGKTTEAALGWVDIKEREYVKIDSGRVEMESARSYRASSTAMRRFTLTDYSNLNAAIGGGSESTAGMEEEKENAESTGEQTVTSLQEWQARFRTATPSNVAIRSSVSQTYYSIQQYTVRYIFDLLFGGMRDRLSRWLEDDMQASESISLQQSQGTNAGFTTNMKVLSLSKETYFTEQEETSFSTVGTVRTSDGREISFQVNVGMSREFQEYYREKLEAADFTMCDPLVINLDTDVAGLSDQTFYFDIDADGELDEISQLDAASGYLALDKNGDGTINDGGELFGTTSGNGFADLARYDEDGNGWIDENDAVWSRLKIWAKNENGEDVLYRLADKGVGAICLQNVSTDFTQRGQNGQTLGAIRNSGIFLYENGNVGTVQHVDVAKYQREA